MKQLGIIIIFFLILVSLLFAASAEGTYFVDLNDTITLTIGNSGIGSVTSSKWSSSDSRIVQIVDSGIVTCKVMGVDNAYGSSVKITCTYKYLLAGTVFTGYDYYTVNVPSNSGSSGSSSSGSSTNSGWCGDRIRWSWSNNRLTLSGTGDMWDYASMPSWNNLYLTQVNISEGITSIGDNAFNNCYIMNNGLRLLEIHVPESVTMIGNYAFRDMAVYLPNNIVSFGRNPFQNCKTVYANKGSVTAMAMGKSHLVFRDPSLNYNLSYLYTDDIITGLVLSGVDNDIMEFTIPDDVTVIGAAFTNCSNLSSIIIPHKITEIGANAFKGCTKLTSIDIPDGVLSLGNSAFYDCKGITDITIPKSVSSIGTSVFENCSSLTQVVIAGRVVAINDSSFKNCINLISIDLPSSVTTIGAQAFYGCNNLTDIVLNSNLTIIGSKAFSGCRALNKVTVPSTILTLGSSVFSDCVNLSCVTFKNGVDRIPSEAFKNCTRLENVLIPDTVTSIGDNAFEGCICLEHLYIPNSVETIGNNAFKNCTELELIVDRGSQAHLFAVNNGIRYVLAQNLVFGTADFKLPANIINIGVEAFMGISAKSVKLSDKTVRIDDRAFADCKELCAMYIPPYVQYISESAFENSSPLVIYGKSGSYAEQYAKNGGYPFVNYTP